MIPAVGGETTDMAVPAEQGDWLRVAEAARLLGVSPNTLRRAGTYGELPCHRSPGGHRRYRRADIDALLGARPAATGTPGSGEADPEQAGAASSEVGELRRRIGDLSALVDVNLAVAADLARGADEVLRTVAKRLCGLTGASECDISLVDGDDLVGAVCYEDGDWDASWEGERLAMADAPTPSLPVRTGRPVLMRGLDDTGIAPALRESMRRWGYAACLTLPLKVRGRVIGVVDLLDREPRDFTDVLEVATSLAQTAAHALDNASLLQRVERQNAALGELVELGAVVSGTREPRAMARTVARRVCEVTGAALCGVYRIAGGRMTGLAIWEQQGLWAPGDSWSEPLAALSATSAAVERHEVLIVADPADERLSDLEREPFERNGYCCEVSVPLIVDDRVVGLIDLFSRERTDWVDDLAFLRSVALLVSGALDKALLLDEVERSNAMLREFVEIGTLSTAAGDVGATVMALAQRLMQTMDVDSCEIYSLEGERLHLVAGCDAHGFAEEWDGWFAPLADFPATAAAVAARETLTISDLDDPRLGKHEAERLREFALRSEICVPLVVEDRAIGIIDVFDTRPRDFAEFRDFLQGVAPVVARTLEHALLVDRLRERSNELDQLVAAGFEFGASLDLEEVLSSTAKRMAEVAGTTGCDLYRLDDDVVHNLISVKGGEVNTPFIGSSFRVSDYYYWEKALGDRIPVFAADILSDPQAYERDRWAATKWGYRAALDLPLVAQGRVIGLAELYSAEPFTFHHIELLQGLAQFAAQAIANASVFAELDRSARRLELVADQSLQLSATLELDAVVAATARSLRESGGFTDCDVFMIEGGELVCVASLVGGDDYPAWIGKRLLLDEWRTVRQAVETGVPVVIESLDDRRLSAEELAVRREYGELSVLIVPLLAKDRVVAVVELIDKGHPRHYDAEQIATAEALSRVAGLALDNAELYSDIKGMHLSNLKALSSALNAKDYYTLGHAARVAAYMVLLGKELGWSTELIRQVEEAAYLHDIGKIGVSDRVLLKPGGLNAHEWELMRQHPIFSADIIRPLFAEPYVRGVRHHHECFDGSGYPDGIAGEEIPEVARMMCVADSYDAMSFRRPYRQALDYAECVAELRRCSGSQFDPEIVEAFLRVLERIAKDREFAARVAHEAATRIDPDEHALLCSRDDESRSEYQRITATLRAVCAEHPPTRYVSSHVQLGKKTVIVCDSREQGEGKPHVGDSIIADDELLEVFAGGTLEANVLLADQWGVWVSGVAPLTDAQGSTVAVLAAGIPATEGITEVEGVRSTVEQTLASMLDSTVAQAGRSEVEAITDALTGLYNHRYFHERLSEEVDRCREEGGELSLLFCDLDNFRAFNELHGHGAGDRAIRGAARIVEDSVRHVDLAARFGGQEFAAILIDTGERGALEVAERIRAGITEARFSTGGDPLSVSIGVASCPADATFKEELIDKADWAMYLAKRRGRNKVLTFSAEHGSDTPERAAAVNPDYVSAMSELVAARTTYTQRRRSAIAHLALAVGRECGLSVAELHAVTRAAGEAARPDPSDEAHKIAALAAAYQAMVAERPYRPQISEAEALAELLACPALLHDRAIADAFSRVLAQEQTP